MSRKKRDEHDEIEVVVIACPDRGLAEFIRVVERFCRGCKFQEVMGSGVVREVEEAGFTVLYAVMYKTVYSSKSNGAFVMNLQNRDGKRNVLGPTGTSTKP